MYSGCNKLLTLLVGCIFFSHILAYSPREDARTIAGHRRGVALNHAKIARELVHRANWASVGTISTNSIVKDYPMVNIISVDDTNEAGGSTGKIIFLLTDLDFTGPDWKHNNKVAFLFTDEQTLNCKNSGKDPMEPTCARAILNGEINEFPTSDPNYNSTLTAFVKRHPAAARWLPVHNFYLCDLNIKNIFVLDTYGGPTNVNVSDYYSAQI